MKRARRSGVSRRSCSRASLVRHRVISPRSQPLGGHDERELRLGANYLGRELVDELLEVGPLMVERQAQTLSGEEFGR